MDINRTPHPVDDLVGLRRAGDDIAGDCLCLIRAGWIAGGLVILLTAVGVSLLSLPLPDGGLASIGTVVLAYKTLVAWRLKRIQDGPAAYAAQRIRALIIWQVSIDGLALAILIHLTGGVASPMSLLLIAHMVIAAAFLNGWLPAAFAVGDVGALALIALLEGDGAVPHYVALPGFLSEAHRDPITASALVATTGAAGIVAAWAAQRIVRRVHHREARVSALMRSIGAVASARELPDLLEALTRLSAETLTAQAAAMCVMDEANQNLIMASAFGQGESEALHAGAGITMHTFETEIMAGKTVIVRDTLRDNRVNQAHHPTEKHARSLIAAPIVGHTQPFGMLCVFASEPEHFSAYDGEFAVAIGKQAGTALEQSATRDVLQKAEQERARFVTMITHDLRAPVAGAQVLLKTLVRGIAGELNDQQRDILVRIENRIEMLMQLVNDLLKLAASKTTDTEEPLQRVLLRPILQFVADRFSKEAEVKQVTIALDVPFEAVSVRATELGLTRIMDNLVGNAVKYTPAGGHICIGVVERPAGVVITVSDTGMGIPSEDMPRIMDGFFRARNARESGIIGTGLGLSIVKQFVDFFGGLISIDSEVGKGTTIKVTLQRAGPADEPALSVETEAGE